MAYMTYHHSQIGGECHTTASTNETKTGTSHDQSHRPSRMPHGHWTVVPHSHEGQSDEPMKRLAPTPMTTNNKGITSTSRANNVPAPPQACAKGHAPQLHLMVTPATSQHQVNHKDHHITPQQDITTAPAQQNCDTEGHDTKGSDIWGLEGSDTLTCLKTLWVLKCHHTTPHQCHVMQSTHQHKIGW